LRSSERPGTLGAFGPKHDVHGPARRHGPRHLTTALVHLSAVLGRTGTTPSASSGTVTLGGHREEQELRRHTLNMGSATAIFKSKNEIIFRWAMLIIVPQSQSPRFPLSSLPCLEKQERGPRVAEKERASAGRAIPRALSSWTAPPAPSSSGPREPPMRA